MKIMHICSTRASSANQSHCSKLERQAKSTRQLPYPATVTPLPQWQMRQILMCSRSSILILSSFSHFSSEGNVVGAESPCRPGAQPAHRGALVPSLHSRRWPGRGVGHASHEGAARPAEFFISGHIKEPCGHVRNTRRMQSDCKTQAHRHQLLAGSSIRFWNWMVKTHTAACIENQGPAESCETQLGQPRTLLL